jgi:phage terminase large subunit-like protein
MAASLHPTTQYAADITKGKIPACRWEKLACKRHLKDLKRVGTEKFPFVFDETRADRIFNYFLFCQHVRGEFSGQPIELEPWQKFDLGFIFGWVHKDTGARRIKTAYIRIARGNGKSSEMSGVVLYGMTGDAIYPPGKPELATFEAKPEVVCLAVDKEQAMIVWGDARDMALASPEILKRLIVKKGSITHATRGGATKRLSKDTKNKDGGSPCIIVIDEYHDHVTSEVKDKTSSGKGKRRQCLEFIITTAGEDAENKPCKKEDDIVKKILNEEFSDETYFGVIREIDDGDDPHDEKNWVKANPMFQNRNAYSNILYDQVKSEHDLAFGSGDNSKIRQWMIKRVNRWQEDSEHKYMSGHMDRFKSLATPRKKFLELTRGLDCFTGLDLSTRQDLTADAQVFRLPDGVYAGCAHGYMPEEQATRHEHSDRIPYKDWAKEGWCTITEGNVTDYRFIKSNLAHRRKDYGWNYLEFCHDPFNASHFIQDLEADGYKRDQMVEVRQGAITLSEPTKFFRELVLQGKFIHDGSPLLTWCVSNAYEIIDSNGNIKLSKKNKDAKQRIDLLAAIINALSRAMVVPKPKPKGRVAFL